MTQKIKIVFIVACVATSFVFLLVLVKQNYAKPFGGIDSGRVFLAGATSILRGEDFPVTQRTPLYCLLLAGLGYIQHIDAQDTIAGALEVGNIHHLRVAKGFLQPPFLRLVLWVQVFLWIITLWFVYKTLIIWGISPFKIAVALALFIVPSFWFMIRYVYDAIWTQFLIAAGVLAFATSLRRDLALHGLVLAGLSFALGGLSRPALQLLSPFLAIFLAFPIANKFSRNGVLKLITTMLIPWFLFVGGWSLRNYRHYGLWGVSSITGVSLCTKTASFVYKAQPYFPEEVPVFISIQNQFGLLPAWGSKASRWLMENRGMTYVQANQFLMKVNLTAIRKAPVRYLYEIVKSLIALHLPNIPGIPEYMKTPAYAAEFILIGTFFLCSFLWVASHLISRFSVLLPGVPWLSSDLMIVFLQCIYWYNAVINSAIDVGKPEQRAPVQFLIPIIIALIAHRLDFGKQTKRKEGTA